jgi:hypothetical protein
MSETHERNGAIPESVERAALPFADSTALRQPNQFGN